MPDIETAKVFVGMPRYGELTSGAARSLYYPSGGAVWVSKIAEAQNSLPCNAFNDLLRIALDLRDAGSVTHFAMIHADVEPEGYWVDELWAELIGQGADLVSAVVPIKDHGADPPTSTAVGDRHDPWKVNRRVRVSERATLPETFGPEHVCGADEVLLVNTGLWITDLRHPAWDAFPGFNVKSDIHTALDGTRTARCRPEDWEMSRYLDRAGARVMATWRVGLSHRGTAAWPNY